MNQEKEETDNGDRQIGTILGRCEILGLFGLAGVGLFLGCGDSATEATPVSDNSTCAVRPELTEGPYFVDGKLNRSDVRTDPATGAVSEGVPLVITFNVSRIGSSACTPLAGATVDIWHCDAAGKYSDVSANGTSGRKFLRGYQTTDADGRATFTTIHPGWYSGRALHIHFKICATSTTGQSYEFTSQQFFDESTTGRL
jgi:protocatechuate 3,4-dioxygenase beta subunit